MWACGGVARGNGAGCTSVMPGAVADRLWQETRNKQVSLAADNLFGAERVSTVTPITSFV